MNKKKIIAFCLVTVALSCFTRLKIKDGPVETGLALSNIEALAGNESGENIMCFGTGSLDCPISHVKVSFIYKYNGERNNP